MRKHSKLMKRAASGLAVIAAAGLCASGLGMPAAFAEPILKRFVEAPGVRQPSPGTTEPATGAGSPGYLVSGAAVPTSRPAANRYQPGTVPPSPSGQQPQSSPQPTRQPSPQTSDELAEDNSPGPVRAALTGFVDRVGRVFRRDTADTRNGPPTDPGGFSYPTASNPNVGRRPQSFGTEPPQVGGADIPSIPPNVNPGPPRVPGVASSKSQPGLFHPPNSATPIVDGTAATDLSITETPIPPLDSILPSASDTVMPAPGEPDQLADGNGIPTVPAGDEEIPSIPPVVSSEVDPAQPSPMVASRPAELSVPRPAQDPFANLFPADRERSGDSSNAATAPSPTDSAATEPKSMPAAPGESEAPAVAATPEEMPPFTGVALEQDLIESAKSAALPATGEPAEIPQRENTVVVQPVPGTTVPTLDLSLPSDMPKLPPVSAAASTPPTTPADLPSEGESNPAPLEVPMTPEVKPAPLEIPMASTTKPVPVETTPTAPAKEPAAEKPVQKPRNEHQSKMERIAARRGLTGFKGFCPVVLRDERDLLDGNEEFTVEFEGREYTLSSRAAMEVFLGDPERYAPAAQGYDVIHQSLTGEKVDGLLDHAVWYRDRLYLFSTVETMETFVAAPSIHAVD